MTSKRGYFFNQRGRKTTVPHLFLGGLFGGNSGGSQSTTSNSTTTMNYDPTYTDLMHKVMGQGSKLMDTPYTPYTGQRFQPFTEDQNRGFQGVRDMQGAWQPYTQQASTAFGRANNMDPYAAGSGYVSGAGNMQTGSQAQQPYFSQASQTWPGAAPSYMNPYMDQVTNRIQQLGNRNLTENLLPSINDAFTRDGGAGFGRDRHAEFTQRALRDTQDSILGTQANALASGYNQGAQAFGADMSRLGQLGTAAGSQANADIGTRAGLGTAAANLAATSKAGDIGLGQAQAGLGQTVQGAGMRDAQGLVTSGGIQQEQGQRQQDFNYQQFQNQMNWPFQMAQFGQGIGQGWQLPYTQTNNTQTNTQMTGPSGSAFGNILGGITGIAGGLQGLGNIGSTVSGWFGGGNAVPGGTGQPYVPGVSYGPFQPGGPFQKGGPVRGHFAAGGYAPVVKGMREGMTKHRGAFGQNRMPMMPQPGGTPMPAMGGPGVPMPMRARGGHFKRHYADGGGVDYRSALPDDYGAGRFTRTPMERRGIREQRIAQARPRFDDTEEQSRDFWRGEMQKFRDADYLPQKYALGAFNRATRDITPMDLWDMVNPDPRMRDHYGMAAAPLDVLGMVGNTMMGGLPSKAGRAVARTILPHFGKLFGASTAAAIPAATRAAYAGTE